jgi:hypothetical protein
MGTFAKTTNVDYRISFVDQGKRTSFFRFRFFPYTCIETYIYINICGRFKRKRKTEAQAIFLNLLIVCSSGKRSLSFVLNKRKLSVCKRSERTKRTCPSIYRWLITATSRTAPSPQMTYYVLYLLASLKKKKVTAFMPRKN